MAVERVLLETGDVLLLETGDALLLESSTAATVAEFGIVRIPVESRTTVVE